MMPNKFAWPVLTAFVMVIAGCRYQESRPAAPLKALVRFQSQVLVDIKVDVHERSDGSWKPLLSGISSGLQPFDLFITNGTHALPQEGELRVTLESVGAAVVPFKPAYRDPAKTPIVWKAPLLATEVQVIELPKDCITLR
jgi:hypothetical protein